MSEADLEDGKRSSGDGARKQVRVQADCFLGFCRMVNLLTGICALLCVVANGMAIWCGPAFVEGYKLFIEQVIRLYGIGFGVLVILAETEWESFLSNFRILDSWLGRGVFQLFCALLTFEMARQKGDSDFHKSLELYRTIASISLVSCSGFYILGGMLCFGVLKRARHKREAERRRVAQSLDELDRKREELSSLLGRLED